MSYTNRVLHPGSGRPARPPQQEPEEPGKAGLARPALPGAAVPPRLRRPGPNLHNDRQWAREPRTGRPRPAPRAAAFPPRAPIGCGALAPDTQQQRAQPAAEGPQAPRAPRSHTPLPLPANDLIKHTALPHSPPIGWGSCLYGRRPRLPSAKENTRGTRASTRWRRWRPAKSQAGLLPPPLGALPLPSGIRLCRVFHRGPGLAVGKRPVRWRRSQPRMQSTRRPLPSALPVAKVKGSGSRRRLRPLRLHLLSLCPRPELVSTAACDPADSRRLSAAPDGLRPRATRAPARRPGPAQWRCVPGSAGRPAARPAPAYNSGASEPLSAPPGAALPAAARGVSRAGPRCRLPAPAPRPQRQKPNRAASILKKEYLYLRNWRHTCPSGDPGPGGPVLGGGAQRGPPSPRAGGGGAGVPGLRGGRVSVTGPRGGVVFCFVCRAPGKGQSS